MLLLTMVEGDSFFIGDIEVTFQKRQSTHQIKVGIDAPKEVTILRDCLYYEANPELKPANFDARQDFLREARKKRRIQRDRCVRVSL